MRTKLKKIILFLLLLCFSITAASFDKNDIHRFLDENVLAYYKSGSTKVLDRISGKCLSEENNFQYACLTISLLYLHKKKKKVAKKYLVFVLKKMPTFIEAKNVLLQHFPQSSNYSVKYSKMKVLDFLNKSQKINPISNLLNVNYNYQEHLKHPSSKEVLYDLFQAYQLSKKRKYNKALNSLDKFYRYFKKLCIRKSSRPLHVELKKMPQYILVYFAQNPEFVNLRKQHKFKHWLRSRFSEQNLSLEWLEKKI